MTLNHARLCTALLLFLAGCAAQAPNDGSDSAADSATGFDCSSDPTVWDCDVQTFFADYCVECHDASPRDFREYDDVVTDAVNTRCGVAPSTNAPVDCATWPPPEQFPIGSGPKPSTEDRQMIVDWIDAGMPRSPSQ